MLAAQLIHAAARSTPPDLPENTHAVALAARDEAHLRFIAAKLRHAGIDHCAIREPDPPWCGALMAIGIVPIADRSAVRHVTRSLKLLR